MFCPLASGCSALAGGMVAQLPVKQHKTKTTNRYFNYIYVRMGAYTLINKRTGNDIWKNLFEFPLIETPEAVSEEEFPALSEFRAMFAEGRDPYSPFGLQGCETCTFTPGDLCQFLYG